MARDNEKDDWPFGRFFAGGFGPRAWAFCGPEGRGRHQGGRRWRQQMFESGEVKYVILRLLKEKPRHGYEVIKALEEKLGGWYTPSAGTVYPTLQLLEDQGYVRAVEAEGKKVYHITPEGEAFLEQHRDVLDEILERVGGAVRGFAGGAMGELSETFARLARLSFVEAWRAGPNDPRVRKILEILKKAAEEIEAAKAPPA
ncbi:MAG TPA: PadR family transcriptional regulator [Gemmatimonadales bacterium]|nr:PadR family transcriptional regulator [Gemmatimonadales bacterium]